MQVGGGRRPDVPHWTVEWLEGAVVRSVLGVLGLRLEREAPVAAASADRLMVAGEATE